VDKASLLAFLVLIGVFGLSGQAAVSQSSEQSDSLLGNATAQFQQGKVREADALVRKYLTGRPNSADGHFLLGHILFREIQEHAVLEEFESAQEGMMSREPSSNSPSPAPSSVSETKQEMAKASLAEFTVGARFRNPSAEDLKTVAFDYVLLGDYSDADKWLTKMLQWSPNDAEGWYFLGRTKYNENLSGEAIPAFEQCLKLDPRNVKAADNLGLALAALGRREEAAAAYRKAIEWQAGSSRKNPGPYIDLASLLIDEDLLQDAVANLQQAVEIAPREPRAHEFLGRAYARVQEFPKAQEELEKAIELSPQSANLHCMLAPIYLREGLKEKAQKESDRCASLTTGGSTPRPF